MLPPPVPRRGRSLDSDLQSELEQRTRELAEARSQLSEALEQQTATSEVLGTIASSPGKLEPVFTALLAKAVRICGAKMGILFLFENGAFRTAAMHGVPRKLVEERRRKPVIDAAPNTALGRITATKRPVQIADVQASPAYRGNAIRRAGIIGAGGARTLISVPMLKESELIGTISVYRKEVRPFTEKQIALLSNFASQAVIAIENTRLLNELREALQQQTATSQVLHVISSSPGDLEPVFETMLENATRICDAKFGVLHRYQDGAFHTAAQVGVPPALADYHRKRGPYVPPPEMPLGRILQTKKVLHTVDQAAAQFQPPSAKLAGARTHIAVPMLKEDEVMGAITIYRTEVRPFTDKQIALVQNFAAQAVIAIENARLLNELRQRTDDLSEALSQQTATSDVLQVISSTPGELHPVFNTMLTKATELCEASYGALWLRDADGFRYAALHGDLPQLWIDALHEGKVTRVRPDTPLARVAQTRKPLQVPDMGMDPSYRAGDPLPVSGVDIGGIRTLAAVPMVKDDMLVGVISIYRKEVRPFTNKQMELLTNFAAQAVIAVENARLVNELRKRTDELTELLEQQTATSEVLKVISASPGDLEPVFRAMLENATRICEASFGVMFRVEQGRFRMAAMLDLPPQLADELLRDGRFVPPSPPGTPLDHVWRTKQVAATADGAALPSPSPAATLGGARSTVAVPMLKDDELVGAFVIYRKEVRPFTDKQIELVSNFAAQAVIAIENTRLLNELRVSLEQQTATSEVLEVISTSPGDLTPVFNSILKNATRICEAKFSHLLLYDGEVFRAAAFEGTPAEFIKFWERGPRTLDPRTAPRQAVTTKKIVHVPDMRQTERYKKGDDPQLAALADLAGARSVLVLPMLKDDQVIGTLSIYRGEPQPFSDKQIQLVGNFARQAVIAIENTRLLSELRQSTEDLTEALSRQTATTEVLQVISASPGELPPVFRTVLENAVTICSAKFGTLFRFDGERFCAAAYVNAPKEYVDYQVERGAFVPPPGAPLNELVRTKSVVRTKDASAQDSPTHFVQFVQYAGTKSHIAVPMLRDNELVGAIVIYHQEVEPFTDKQVELVQNFASQAVIAIENTRLLNELRQRTDDLSEALKSADSDNRGT